MSGLAPMPAGAGTGVRLCAWTHHGASADACQLHPLEPGDLVFTGTPAGVGDAQDRCLVVGQRIDSHIVGVGHMVTPCV